MTRFFCPYMAHVHMVAYDPGRCPGLCKGKALQAFGRLGKGLFAKRETVHYNEAMFPYGLKGHYII